MRRLALPLLLSLFAVACAAHIGDPCSSNRDCNAAAGHTCDVSAPGGYCLLYGCRANSCPSEAWCATFTTGPRTQSYCLRKCASSDDCRDGYRCRTDLGTPGGVCFTQ